MVLIALSLVVLLGFMALAVDVGYLRYQKRQLQTAADAAAIAAAAELSYGDATAAADADSAANGFTNGSNGVTVTVNNPPASGPHSGDSNYVEAIVSRSASTFFAKSFGVTSTRITARAVAHLGGSTSCVYALAPSGGSTLEVVSHATLDSTCGLIAESNGSGAFSCKIPSTVSAPYIGVVGSFGGGCPAPVNLVTGIAVPSPSDPLTYLPKPSVGACTFSGQKTYNSSNSPKSSPSVLNPGVYCGGIAIKASAYVVFNPGVYILTSSKSPGGISIDIGSYVSTNTSSSPYGVTFYNYGPAGSVTFTLSAYSTGEYVSLIAPTSGTYQGVLFFQDPGDTATAQIIGMSSDSTVLQGTYYFPAATLNIAYSGTVAYNAAVANVVVFDDLSSGSQNFTTTNITNNYSSLTNGSPVKGGGALSE